MANGIRGNIIRSRTGSCNREDRPSVKRQLAQARFGLFRPLIMESANELSEGLEPAQKSIDVYLSSRKRFGQRASVQQRSWFGVTYLSPHNSAEAIRKEELDLFAGRRVAKVLSANNAVAKTVNVPINGFEWYGHKENKLAAVIRPYGSIDSEDKKMAKLLQEVGPRPWTKEQSEREEAGKFEQLAELSSTQKKQIQVYSGDADAIRYGVIAKSADTLTSEVFTPDYIPILSYDTPCHSSVAETHKQDIQEIMYDHFDFEDEPLTVSLGHLMLESDRPD
ncbi:MAG: hypothetical protein U0524_01585 [Candidatus Saccharimonadales bacterium]